MVARLRDAILRGNRAGQPAAGDVDVGTVYYVTDENVTERSNGSTWDDISDGAAGGGAPTDAEYVVTASNGSLSAEKVVKAPASGGSIPKIIRKTADESVTSSTALQDDDELLFAIAASEIWEFEINVWHQNSGGTGDLKWAITVPAGATIYYSETGLDAGGGVQNDAFVSTTSGNARTQDTSATTIRHFRVKGMCANGATPGNVQFQWAQNTSNGTATVVKANSAIKAHQLA